MNDAEQRRLEANARREEYWVQWGPYLPERQWATVREDYSANGDPWAAFPHEHARSRAYRWGEDGLLGWCDLQCRLCFSFALWNERDPILKERLFGLTNPEGNHGEDLKEEHHYIDATPTSSWGKGRYRYPQGLFPYEALAQANARASLEDREFELEDTGVFDEQRYFDFDVTYAKVSPREVLIELTAHNRGPEARPLHVLPTLWFRNTWAWGQHEEDATEEPSLVGREGRIDAEHPTLGAYTLELDPRDRDGAEVLVTFNESNAELLWGAPSRRPQQKDAFHRRVVNGERGAVALDGRGTKGCFHLKMTVPARGSRTVRLRLFEGSVEAERPASSAFGADFDRVLDARRGEADAFYDGVISPRASAEERAVARQAYAGLLWTKQFYYYVPRDWLDGDPAQPRPPKGRTRNQDWAGHLYNRDVLSIPDKWEYPWYAAWDLAFHMVPMARIDPFFARAQLELFLREWYLHPNGQLPAYEFHLSDVNPPVHAWASLTVHRLLAEQGHSDPRFLQHVFQKLLMNFTWWVNQKDEQGDNLFEGGFLGLDNIGLFDRSKPLPTGGRLEQSDGTAWMAFYAASMLEISLELAKQDRSYEDLASKFFEHFLSIASAINALGGDGLWDERDGFFYDHLNVHGQSAPLRIRSMVGIIPLFAVCVVEQPLLDRLDGFTRRSNWLIRHRPDLAEAWGTWVQPSAHGATPRRMLSLLSADKLRRVLSIVLDEREFLSPFGVRSLSKRHEREPFVFRSGAEQLEVRYVPAESDSRMFGGNSNWRGPVWMPVNYLLIESLEHLHEYFGDDLRVECPTGSGRWMNLHEVALELCARLSRLFLPDASGRRPCHTSERWVEDEHLRALPLFYEYFHGDSGRGCGASHQTGWTALVAECIERVARERRQR
jgi:hypothetical protein